MKSKKIISAVAAFAILFAATSCGGTENDNDMNKITLPNYDEYETEYETVISGWLIPSSLNETNVKWIKEAGISVLHANAAGNEVLSFPSYDQKAKAALDLLGNNGVKVYVNTGSRDGASYQKISSFKQNSAVLGMSLDEPNKAEITSMAQQVAWWNANADGRDFYCNLFPSFAQVVQNDFGGDYASYLNYYCDNVLDNLTTGDK